MVKAIFVVAPDWYIIWKLPSARKRKFPYHYRHELNLMAKSSSRLKPTNSLIVPFRVLKLLDNWWKLLAVDGMETGAILH